LRVHDTRIDSRIEELIAKHEGTRDWEQNKKGHVKKVILIAFKTSKD